MKTQSKQRKFSLNTTQIARRKLISGLFKALVMALAITAVIPLLLIFATLIRQGYRGVNIHYEAPTAMVQEEGDFFFWVEDDYRGPLPSAWLEDTTIVTNSSGTLRISLNNYFTHSTSTTPLHFTVVDLSEESVEENPEESALEGAVKNTTITQRTTQRTSLSGDTATIFYDQGETGEVTLEISAFDPEGAAFIDTLVLSLYQGPYVIEHPQGSLANHNLALSRNGLADTLLLSSLFGHTSSADNSPTDTPTMPTLQYDITTTPEEIVSTTFMGDTLIVTPLADTVGVVKIAIMANDQNYLTAETSLYATVNGSSLFHISNVVAALPLPEGEIGGGIFNAIVGSMILILIAVLIALPTGVLGGFYLAEHPRSPRGEILRLSMEILQGVPSIVIGIIINYVLVMKLRFMGSTFSALAGGVSLAIMMLPVLVRTTEETLKMLPGSLKEASLALGAPYYHTVLKVLLPAGINGIVTGLLISVARIAGETAPLLFTSFGNDLMSYHPLKPIAALPLYIYRYAISAFPVNQQMAWGASAVLIIFILALNFLARFIASRFDMTN